MTTRQRFRLMVGVLCLWVLTSVLVFGVSSEPLRVPLENVSGRVAAASGGRGESRTPGLQVNVKLFELERSQRAQPYPSPRNIFGTPGQSGAGMTASAPPRPEAGMDMSTTVDSAPASGDSAVRYLGFVEGGAHRGHVNIGVVVVGDDLHMVRAGDRLGDRLRVTSVTAEHLIAVEQGTHRPLRFPVSESPPGESQF